MTLPPEVEREDEIQKTPSYLDKEPAALMKDTYTTIEEAQERAKELGCEGTHYIDVDGDKFYMACAAFSRSVPIELTGFAAWGRHLEAARRRVGQVTREKAGWRSQYVYHFSQVSNFERPYLDNSEGCLARKAQQI